MLCIIIWVVVVHDVCWTFYDDWASSQYRTSVRVRYSIGNAITTSYKSYLDNILW